MKPLLTPADLAGILQCSTGHVYRLVQKRQVPFLKLKGSVRFREETIERWIKEQEITSVRQVIRGIR